MITCPTCNGDKRVLVTDDRRALGLVTCTTCRGSGSLPERNRA